MAENAPGTQEREPASYDAALETARKLKAAGVRDPYDAENPKAGELPGIIESWEHSRGLHLAGGYTPEKAVDIVKAARLYLEAGYTSKAVREAALERLQNEHAMAVREGAAGAAEILSAAADALEGGSPTEERMPAKLVKIIGDAALWAAEGKFNEAVGALTLALIDPRFKRLPAEVLDRLKDRRDEYKSQMK